MNYFKSIVSQYTYFNISISDTFFLNFTLNNMIISPFHSSKNLGIVFDDKLSPKIVREISSQYLWYHLIIT